ncbi:proton-coupled amino acid transporter 1-like isoform X1 [Lytechinus variegatus]|uniref:proton-coupled amino acid transporter 1-like isoform X1 n=1 Tax=Lytechinus variegatus TaxID=7654 RepID=UPI001BB2305B|nr:proton-coupled amino acid transporter 1-like isoform X1 [Lytechinus variegatus]XP_041476595.1 proton-coupled amino acid transporter 1-like isoform X1 [Lytechinus variegatus]
MSQEDYLILPQDRSTTRTGRSFTSKCGQLFLDNANIFKAFIGTNFLSISFALSMSGLYLGIAGLVLIATATVHCCYLIVKCKRYAIEDIVRKFNLHPESSHTHRKLVQSIEKSLSYGDISRLTLGRWGTWVTNISLLVTQLGFCINYFIFIGNTIQRMFPVTNSTVVPASTIHPRTPPQSLSNADALMESTTQTANWTHVMNNAHSSAPPYQLLMLIPFPIFIVFALLRKIRQLGSSSIIANGSVLIAYVVVMYYILRDFEINSTIVNVNWKQFPVFFGQVTASYEGIGTIIPIESSMEGNRHLYPLLLHINVTFFTLLMASIGIMGYLYYGKDVEQMIIWSLPLQDPLTIAVNVTLVIAIVFTYPLQVFPIVEIMEQLIFAPGQCLGPSKQRMVEDGVEDSINKSDNDREDLCESTDEKTQLLQPSEDEETRQMMQTFRQCVVTVTIPDSVATWKRNTLRVLIVVFQAGVALTLKNSIAYFSAFTGAIGSTILGFILPCTIHLVLRGKQLNPVVWIKNIFLIVIGVAGGVAGVYVSIVSIIDHEG